MGDYYSLIIFFQKFEKGRRSVSHVQSIVTFPFENALCFIKDHATRDSSPNVPLATRASKSSAFSASRSPSSRLVVGCKTTRRRKHVVKVDHDVEQASSSVRDSSEIAKTRVSGTNCWGGRRQFFVVRPVLGTTLVEMLADEEEDMDVSAMPASDAEVAEEKESCGEENEEKSSVGGKSATAS